MRVRGGGRIAATGRCFGLAERVLQGEPQVRAGDAIGFAQRVILQAVQQGQLGSGHGGAQFGDRR